MDPLLQSVYRILVYGQNTNSYKFALLRALADISRTRGAETRPVSLETLAKSFVGYYWSLTTEYRVRQSTDPAKDPVVMKAIRELAAVGAVRPRESVKAFAGRTPATYRELVGRVASTAFGDVIPRFHVVRRQKVSPQLYEATREGLLVKPTTWNFLRQHADLLRYLAVAAWVKFTQAHTTAPRLFEKIADQPPNRKTAAYRRPLEEVENAECFYCGAAAASLVIDHVIPWSYVLEDRAWNLVLACGFCNAAKSDGLPQDRFIERLISRNAALAVVGRDLPPRILKDLKEWGSAERLSEHVRKLFEQAHQDEFPIWGVEGSSEMS